MTAEIKAIPPPETKELVSQEVLRVVSLAMQMFSGQMNPSALYHLMVLNSPNVYPFYREIEAKDTAIASAMDLRRLLTLARPMTVAPSNAKEGRSQEYADGLTSFLKMIPRLNFAKWELLDAPAYGMGIVEIMWGTDGGRVWVDRLIGRPQELFRYNKLFYPQTGDLLLAQTVGGEGAPVPQSKFLVASYHPRAGDRRGLPILRDLFWPSWFKRQALRLHLHFLEKGPGTIAVQYPLSADKNEQNKALQAAMDIANELAVAVPEGFTILEKLLTTTRTRSAEDFRSMVDYFDAEMTRRILGQTLTTHGSENARGSQALGAIHEEMMYEIVRNDCQDVEDVMNEQLAMPWLLWTYGPDALTEPLRPRIAIEKDPPHDAADALALIQNANKMVPVLKREVYAAAQLTQPDKTDDVVTPPTVPTTMFEPGAAGPV